MVLVCPNFLAKMSMKWNCPLVAGLDIENIVAIIRNTYEIHQKHLNRAKSRLLEAVL